MSPIAGLMSSLLQLSAIYFQAPVYKQAVSCQISRQAHNGRCRVDCAHGDSHNGKGLLTDVRQLLSVGWPTRQSDCVILCDPQAAGQGPYRKYMSSLPGVRSCDAPRLGWKPECVIALTIICIHSSTPFYLLQVRKVAFCTSTHSGLV